MSFHSLFFQVTSEDFKSLSLGGTFDSQLVTGVLRALTMGMRGREAEGKRNELICRLTLRCEGWGRERRGEGRGRGQG